MLIAEYDYDTDIAVQRAEASRIAFAQGMERGMEQGMERGSLQAKLETARLMLQRNYPIAEVCLMTGLTEEDVESIHN